MTCSSCGGSINYGSMKHLCAIEYRISGRCATCQDSAFAKIYCVPCGEVTPHSKRPGDIADMIGCHLCNRRLRWREVVFSNHLQPLHIVSKCLACNEDYVSKIINGMKMHLYGSSTCAVSETGHTLIELNWDKKTTVSRFMKQCVCTVEVHTRAVQKNGNSMCCKIIGDYLASGVRGPGVTDHPVTETYFFGTNIASVCRMTRSSFFTIMFKHIVGVALSILFSGGAIMSVCF